MRRCAVALVLALAVSGCGSPLEALNAVTPNTGYTRQQAIAYGDDDRQRLDVYRPASADANGHTILFVYGGAWRDGRRQDYEFVAGALAEAGHTVILPDYRLYPEVRWPRFAEDVAAALQRVQSDADALIGRPLDDVVLMGHSSGAHTVAVMAADPGRWQGDAGPRVAGLVALSGPYDLPLENPEVAPVFSKVTDRRSVLPVELASASHPPTLLLHGDDDERVLPKHTERYAEALRAAGADVQVAWLEGAGHASVIAAFAAPLDLLNDAAEQTNAWLDALPTRPQRPAPDG